MYIYVFHWQFYICFHFVWFQRFPKMSAISSIISSTVSSNNIRPRFQRSFPPGFPSFLRHHTDCISYFECWKLLWSFVAVVSLFSFCLSQLLFCRTPTSRVEQLARGIVVLVLLPNNRWACEVLIPSEGVFRCSMQYCQVRIWFRVQCLLHKALCCLYRGLPPSQLIVDIEATKSLVQIHISRQNPEIRTIEH